MDLFSSDGSGTGGERHLAGIIASAMDAIISVDQKQRVVLFNEAAEKMFGYTATEALGRSLDCFIPDRFRHSHREHVRTFARTNFTVGRKGEGRNLVGLRSDGTEFPIEVSISQLELAGKKLFTAIVRDITERTLAMEALREANEFNHQILTSARDGIIVYDRHLRYRVWNPFMEELSGVPARAVIGKKPPDVFPFLREWGVYANLEKALEGETVAAHDYPCAPPISTRAGWLSGSYYPLRDASSQIAGVIEIIRDITDRKKAEEELRESKARLAEIADFAQTVIASSPIGIATYDGVSGQCVSANEAVAKIIGCTTEAILKQNFKELASWKVSPLLNDAQVALLNGDTLRNQAHILTSFGKDSWLEYVFVPFTVKLRPHLLLMMSDITEQKQLEEQFRQAQKMEAVGRFAGGMAHDFNNMLGVIIGYSQLLQDKLGPEDSGGKQLAEIKKAADRATALTRQLLAFSRKQVLYPAVLDPNAVVQDLEKMLGRMIGEDIELVIRLGAGVGSILADPSQLEQVLMNLAVNARDAMPKGGHFIIETANVDIDEMSALGHQPMVTGPCVMLAVSDNGCGMDAHTQEHIFEPFFTTKDPGKGTGLGLSMVYGVVKQSGGYIWVYSELGRGTTFKIYLPRVNQAAAVDAPREAPPADTLASGTILLVEDEEPMRRLASSLLAQAGYTVIEAECGVDGLALAHRHSGAIDLLLTDVVMPRMSGKEMADRLLTLRPGMNVLYMSGYTDDLPAKHGILGPGMRLLQKPFTRESLVGTVREILSQNSIENGAMGT
ncbi:MAG TPA: PAS domain S-box protein [Candidatus Sulfotelmatobacter sp.]|nr:PAS domain S-box protein [Candidatus Sulfotelmatobacter sp.]